jgi:hypothetical protein
LLIGFLNKSNGTNVKIVTPVIVMESFMQMSMVCVFVTIVNVVRKELIKKKDHALDMSFENEVKYE